MQVYDSPAYVPSILTWGVFDGVHRGHQEVLERAASWAREECLKAAAVTFRQHPDAAVRGSTPEMITSLQHRLLLMSRLHLDAVIVLDFDRKLAETSAEDFVKEILVGQIGARGLVLGFNCRFGKGGAGDYRLLETVATELGIPAREAPPIYYKGKPISSTMIRKCIAVGDLQSASEMLGRPVSLYGTVVQGSGRGRKLGFPTANLELHHEIHPPSAVYLCRASVRGELLPALTSIGTQPTFRCNTPSAVVEVHIIDFSGDLCGTDIEVQMLEKVREQIRFESDAKLSAQIAADVALAREKLSRQS